MGVIRRAVVGEPVHGEPDFHYSLWERPDLRKRRVLRHRNETSVQVIADGLAWSVAVSLDRIMPTDILGGTIRPAVLDEYAGDMNRQAVGG